MQIQIVLADDHAVIRDGLRALIERHDDLKVIGTAGNGREAVDVVARLRPDVVVMDVSMPHLDGVDATRFIRDRSPESRVLILSMHLSSEHIYRCLRAGALGYVLKDSAGEEVVDAIRAVRAGKRYLSQRITEAMIDSYAADLPRVSPLDSLSLRERDVLQMVVEGQSSPAIAKTLSVSVKTVETYRARLTKKLGVKDTVGLVKFAVRHGLTE